MIDIEKTINLRGYDPLMLSYGSGKDVWAICNICGNSRWLNFQHYSNLCRKCAKNLPGAKEAVSIQFKEYYSDPEHCKENSDRRIQYFIDNPEACQSVSMQFKEYYSDPDNKKAKSDQMIQYYIDHPEARDEISKTVKKYLEDHPEAVDEFIARMEIYWGDQKHRDELSEIIKNSNAHKAAMMKTRGGNDIVDHHISYDFGRPEALIVKVTRSFHGQIHHPKGIPLTERGYSLID